MHTSAISTSAFSSPRVLHGKYFIELSFLVMVVQILSGCSTPGSMSVKKSANETNGNFHLYISDQSFAISPVDIKVFIDGELITKGNFDTGDQHNWQEFVLALSPGQHKLVAESINGGAKLEKAFELDDKAWAALAFCFYPKPTGGAKPFPRQFIFDLSKKPIYFF